MSMHQHNSHSAADLPSGWSIFAFGEIAESQYGISIAVGDGVEEAETVPMLGMRNLQDGVISFANVSRVTLSENEVDPYKLREGDILFNRTNSADLVGKTALVTVNPSEPTVFASYLVRLSIKPELATPAFINHVMNDSEAQRLFRDLATPGVGQYNINPTVLKKHFRVCLPLVPEQRAITEVVSAWDRGICQTTDLIAANRRQKQGLLQQLLEGNRRYPEFSDDLRKLRLRDVTQECSDRNNLGLGNESVMAVTKAEGIVPMRERLIGAEVQRYKQVHKNWFAYNPMRINIGSIARSHRNETILVSPDYVVFRCREETEAQPGVDPDYLDHLLESNRWSSFVSTSGNGSVRVRIYYDDLGSMPLLLPRIEEQRKIAKLLNAIDSEISLLTEQLAALKTQKKGLMRKLLTGEVRVKVPS